MDKFKIVSEDDGEYRVRVDSDDGSTSFTLIVDGVDNASDGRLADDETTARAAIRYLLSHQDASDLPPRIELVDVFAAYSDAIERIEAMRS